MVALVLESAGVDDDLDGTELLPVLGVGVLVLLTWWLCARGSRVAAWLSATFAMCLAASTALPV